jgi:quinoprotein glucose dehydrogenase
VPERQAAINMLAQLDLPAARQAISDWFNRVENGKCPPELQLDVLEAAAQSTDAALAERQKKYAEHIAAEGPLAAYAACISGGDAERGRKQFEENAALSCRRCHSLTPGENLVGPSLAAVGAQRTRSELLESLVAPNAKIVEGFQTTVLQLDTGKVVAGILRREDAQRAVLLDAEGKELIVDIAEVEDRFEGLSAMPEDLVKQMTRRDVRDLVEYLSTLRAGSVSGDP